VDMYWQQIGKISRKYT